MNIGSPGDVDGWHFDNSDLAVSILLQKPENGGQFQHTALVRGEAKETGGKVLKTVEKAIEKEEGVKTLALEPGTLTIFRGSRVLHQLTEVKGESDRLVAVLCYSNRPGNFNSHEVQKSWLGNTCN